MSNWTVIFYTFLAAVAACFAGAGYAIDPSMLECHALVASCVLCLAIVFYETRRTWWMPFAQVSVSTFWAVSAAKTDATYHLHIGWLHFHYHA